jgi:hypothetical protein
VLRSTLAVDEPLADWDRALQSVVKLAEHFYTDCASTQARDALFSQLLRLRGQGHWRGDLEPAIDEKFWGAKGILRVILSIRLNRVVGFKLQDVFAVLHSGLQTGPSGQQPWAHLFLLAWDVYRPDSTNTQRGRVNGYLSSSGAQLPDRRYDAFVSMLFPEMRWRLRAQGRAGFEMKRPN